LRAFRVENLKQQELLLSKGPDAVLAQQKRRPCVHAAKAS
jgi:hypothetical protein